MGKRLSFHAADLCLLAGSQRFAVAFYQVSLPFTYHHITPPAPTLSPFLVLSSRLWANVSIYAQEGDSAYRPNWNVFYLHIFIYVNSSY